MAVDEYIYSDQYYYNRYFFQNFHGFENNTEYFPGVGIKFGSYFCDDSGIDRRTACLKKMFCTKYLFQTQKKKSGKRVNTGTPDQSVGQQSWCRARRVAAVAARGPERGLLRPGWGLSLPAATWHRPKAQGPIMQTWLRKPEQGRDSSIPQQASFSRQT